MHKMDSAHDHVATYRWVLSASLAMLILSASGCSEPSPNPLAESSAAIDARNRGSTVPRPTIIACPASTGILVTISGITTYDFIPHSANGPGLNYRAKQKKPARGVSVQAIDSISNAIISSTTTSASGAYSVSVPDNTNVTIRVLADLVQTNFPSANFHAVDNTANNAQWAMQGAQACTGTTNKVRNLNAASGWSGSAYTRPRIAGPFAIIDDVYDAVTLIRNSVPNTDFPALSLNWSPNNIPIGNNTAIGEIGTSYYDGTGIFILGAANTDTDEYDQHVIWHEFAHYVEDHFSRSDSIGGEHLDNDLLDLRVAFGEGLGNAFSAMVNGDPDYKDSNGPRQTSGYGFNLESTAATTPGWFNEISIQAIIYDLFDSVNDGPDTVSMGFSPLYNVLLNQEKTTPAFTSIFSFVTALKASNPSNSAAIDQLVSAQGIVSASMDAYGTNETNNGGVANSALPIYTPLAVGAAAATSLCTDAVNGVPNKLGNHRFLRLNIASAGSHTITVSGDGAAANPDFYLYQAGVFLQGAFAAGASDSLVRNFAVGDYILDIFDFNLLYGPRTGSSCLTVAIK